MSMPPVHAHVPFDRIEEHLPLILERRLNLEIYFNGAALDALTPARLRETLRLLEHRPSLTFHAPFMDLSPGAVDAKVRAATVERFNQVLDAAAVLEPRCIVFHSGYEKWKYAFDVELWIEKSLMTWRPLLDRARTLGAQIAIENIFEDEPSNLRLLMERMASPGFGICFDAGHANLFSPLPLAAWLDALGDYIIELHLHDNDRSRDQHLPPGDGTVDFPALFSRLRGRDCIYTIEAHTAERLLTGMERLRELLDRR